MTRLGARYLAYVIAAGLLLLAAFASLSCARSSCTPATVASINAEYIAAGAQACAGVPFEACSAVDVLKAKRIAEEKAAGCP